MSCVYERMNPEINETDQIMEEELNYVTVIFKTKPTSAHEDTNSPETVYEEVKIQEPTEDTQPVKENTNKPEIIFEEMKTEEPTQDTQHVTGENQKKAPSCTLLHLVAAGLGIVCIVLVSAVIALSMHLSTVVSERSTEKLQEFTAQMRQLQTEKDDLERRAEGLSRKLDGINWTMGVILEYEYFPVGAYCPHKVCKPCRDNWVLFQSSCYQFLENSYQNLKTWSMSRDECHRMNADLVVIESQEEQEFINNHTKVYRDNHGYWLGLSKNVMETWTWVDGSNITVRYWTTPAYLRGSCALTQPNAAPLANWDKVRCDGWHRWICETKALMKDS